MQRPTSVTVFAVLNIVFAVVGITGILFSLLLFLPHVAVNNPVIQLIHDSPAYSVWLKFSILVGVAECGLLLAAGIGLLQLQSWARKISIGYAIYAMVGVVFGTVVNYFLMVLPLMEQAQQKSGPEEARAIGAAIGGTIGTIGSCFGLVYPILLLIFMLRANVVAAFSQRQP